MIIPLNYDEIEKMWVGYGKVPFSPKPLQYKCFKEEIQEDGTPKIVHLNTELPNYALSPCKRYENCELSFPGISLTSFCLN